MNALQNLTLRQKLIGVGIVLVGIAAWWTRRSSPAPAEPDVTAPADPPAGIIPGETGDSAAIGTGTLAEWSATFTAALGDLSGRLGQLETGGSTTPAPATPGNPKAPSNIPKAQLGHRQTTSRNVQPAGRGFPGETMSEMAQRLYGDRGYWNFVRYFNGKVWPGSPDKAVRAGTVIYY